MSRFHYKIVAHDGGWAYTLDGTFSEPYPTAEVARKAAQFAAAQQHVPDGPAIIEYQDAQGEWRIEKSEGGNRPDVDVME